MAEPISIQQLKDASEDAITLADFIYKPANAMIPRRLAGDINSLQYYLEYMSSYAQHSYETYNEMVTNAVNLPNGVSAFVTNDLDPAKNGIYTYNGTSFVKGDYQPENAAKEYVEAKLGGLEVFDGKVRAQDVSTADGSTQDIKNMDFRNELDALPFEGGVLADTFVTATANGVGTVTRTQRDKNSDFVTVKDFGVKGDGTDESAKLRAAIYYAQVKGLILDGLGLTCEAHNLPFISNMYLRNISINCNKFDTMVSIFVSTYGTPSFIENITLENVYLNGKRELHTNVNNYADGGRCCIFVRQPIRNLLLKNCRLNNAVTDGIMILPIDWNMPYTFMRCQNITYDNVEMCDNGRHGGSIDNVDTLHIIGGNYNRNGLHVDGVDPLDYTLGTSARLVPEGTYGSGFVLEEYLGTSLSKNVVVDNPDMTKNAGIGLSFVRTGIINNESTGIHVRGGSYDYGTGTANTPKIALNIGAYGYSASTKGYKGSIQGVNLNGGNLAIELATDMNLSAIQNLGKILIKRGQVYIDKEYSYEILDAINTTVYRGAMQGKDTYLGLDGEATKIQINMGNVAGNITKLNARGYGLDLGGLAYDRAGNGDTLGVALNFYYGEADMRWQFDRYGNFNPKDNEIALGKPTYRLKEIHSASALIVTSDANKKTQVTELDEAEKSAALEIKSLIRKYKFIDAVEEKGDEARWHFGVIAQEVEQVLIDSGLNPEEYGFLCKDIDEDGVAHYAIRYSELIMFMLSVL